MSKKDLFSIFQTRLRQAFDARDESISDFARNAGVDRSTLSQLLSPNAAYRLPRADTIAAIAGYLNVSADWLLGLSEVPEAGADLINRALHVDKENAEANPWLDWVRQAGDAKIRYVSVTGLPHQLKTPETITHEFSPVMGEKEARKYASSEFREEMAKPGQHYEVCASAQLLHVFAAGGWIWNKYPTRARRTQLEHMAEQLEILYPDYQLYLFDEVKIISVPLILFGQSRAVLNMNGTYLSFTRADHVAFFSSMFKEMIRHTLVHPHEVAGYIRKLAEKIT